MSSGKSSHFEKFFTLFFWGAVIFGGYKFISYTKQNNKSSSDSLAADPRLVQISKEMNKQLPMMVDEYTRLDSTFPGPSMQIAYYYTLVKMPGKAMDQRAIRDFSDTIIKGVCATPTSTKVLDAGVIMEYIYKLNDGTELTRFEIRKSDCGAP